MAKEANGDPNPMVEQAARERRAGDDWPESRRLMAWTKHILEKHFPHDKPDELLAVEREERAEAARLGK